MFWEFEDDHARLPAGLDRARELLSLPASRVFDAMDEDSDVDDPAGGSGIPPDLLRAWWAAVFGLMFCPPVFTICSMLLLLRHDFSERPYWDWRVTATFAINLFTLAIVVAIAVSIGVELLQFSPSTSPLFPQLFQQQ